MYTVKLYNNIAPKGLDQFTDAFEVGEHLGTKTPSWSAVQTCTTLIMERI